MTDKKLFDRTIDDEPEISEQRLAFGTGAVNARNITIATFFSLIKDWFLINVLNNYLAKDNKVSYTPTEDYHPATVKYVKDTKADDANYLDITFGSTVSDAVGKASEANKNVHFTGRFKDNNMQDDDAVFELPTSISPPPIDVYVDASTMSGGPSARLKISAGARLAVVEDQETSTGTIMIFNATYQV